MDRNKSFDDEWKSFLELLFYYHVADDDWKKDFLTDISDWFDENAVYVGAADINLHQAISHILDDGMITDEEYDTLTHFIMDHINTHEKFDYKTYSQGKQRLSHEEIESIVPYEEGDEDFIGKTVVITGEFEKFPKRKEAEVEIRRRGGRTVSSVSGRTDMLIYGRHAGWAKIEQVRQRNLRGGAILLVNEGTFYKMLETNEAIDE